MGGLKVKWSQDYGEGNTLSSERFVFAGGHRKSGTTMFLNLFDGHPDCCVFPTDISVLYGYFPVYTAGDFSTEQRLERLDRVIFGVTLEGLRDKHALGERLPVERVREHFFANLDHDKLDQIDVIIRQIIASFREAIGLPVEKAPIVVIKETSLEIYAQMLSAMFPGAQFIQVLRDPRDNYAALHAGVEKHYRLFGESERHILASLLNRVGTAMRLIKPNTKALGDDHLMVLGFEALVQDPSGSMRDVARFAGIDFTPALTSPSVMGLPTAGNNYDDQQFFKVSARNVGRWRERITDEEAQVIEFHLGDIMERYGYDLAFPPEDSARAAADFYRWSNYCYFFKDSFALRS
jgi:sulfotransferase family protein